MPADDDKGASSGAAALRLRPAAEGDVPLILELIRGLAEYERLEHEMVATADGIRDGLFGPRPVIEVVIAELGGEAAGFALFFASFSTFLGRPGLYLEDLFVRPTLRGRGVGKALLAHLAQLTRARGWGRLEWAVLDWNEPAIGFYRRLGARSMDEWTINRVTGEALTRLSESVDLSGVVVPDD